MRNVIPTAIVIAAGIGATKEGQPPSPGGWAASIRHGGGEAAHLATVQFVNSRAFPGCQLHYVL